MPDSKGGQIGAELTLDTRSFSKGLEDAQKKAEGAAGKIQSAFAQLSSGNILGGLSGGLGSFGGILASFGSGGATAAVGAAGAAVAATAREFKALVNEGTEVIKQQQQMSRQFGLSAEQAGALGVAARRFNVDQEAMSAGMQHFLRHVVELRDNANGPAGQIFRRWGVDIQQLTSGGNMQALRALADAMQKLSPEERLAAGREIAGRHGQDFTAMLARVGGNGLAAMQERGEAEGLFLNSDELKRFQEVDRYIKNIRAGSNEIRIRIAVQMARDTHEVRAGLEAGWEDVKQQFFSGLGMVIGGATGNRQSFMQNAMLWSLPAGSRAAVAAATGSLAANQEEHQQRDAHVSEVFRTEQQRLQEHISALSLGTKTQQELRDATERQKLSAEGLSATQIRAIGSLQAFAHSLEIAQGFRERAERLRQDNALAGESPLGRELGAVREQAGKAFAGSSGFAAHGALAASAAELQEQLRQGAQNRLRRENETPLDRYERELREAHESANGDQSLEAQARGSILRRFEGQLGLNRPARLAGLATQGSAAAAATIGAARFQAAGGNTVEERMAALLQELVNLSGKQLTEAAGIRNAQEKETGPAKLDNLN